MYVEKSKTNVIIDSNSLLKEDSVRVYTNWIDSLVITHSNLIMLKYAMQDKIKNSPIMKSDSVKTVEKIRKIMQDYYRSKYPTAVYKFGDNSPGIPIEKILNIFGAKDTVDLEKIKKYLKIGEYNNK
jgi:hypothetical protein